LIIFGHVGELESSKSAIKTLTPLFRALIIIFLSTGPVISTLLSFKSSGIEAIFQSDSLIDIVSSKKLGKVPLSTKTCFKFLLFNICVATYITFFTFLIIQNLQNNETKLICLYSIGVCIASDLGGFIFGKIIKGKKLTKISPNKTISGSIGSFISASLLMVIYYNSISNVYLYYCIMFALLVCSFSQIGDLFISYLKRKAKIKNSGKILPGNGGILDRVDGIIFGTPIGIYSSFLIT